MLAVRTLSSSLAMHNAQLGFVAWMQGVSDVECSPGIAAARFTVLTSSCCLQSATGKASLTTYEHNCSLWRGFKLMGALVGCRLRVVVLIQVQEGNKS